MLNVAQAAPEAGCIECDVDERTFDDFPADPIARVRRSCARLGAQATFAWVGNVRGILDEVEQLFLNASEHRAAAWCYDVDTHYRPADPTDGMARARTATYMLLLAAINFGSGYAPWLRRDPTNSTYYTLSTKLARAFDDRALYKPEVLNALSIEDVATIFDQDLAEPQVRAFLEKVRGALRQIAGLLMELPSPDGVAFLESVGFDSSRIVEKLIKLPTFNDCCAKADVFFYKKAQLFAADIARLGRFYQWWDVSGVDQLTLFADNAVAQVLRILGVIELREDLAARIDSGTPLAVCSDEEIEIRASTINAGQMLVAKIRERNPGRALDIVELDYYLWKISHENPFYAHKKTQRHRSLGEFY